MAVCPGDIEAVAAGLIAGGSEAHFRSSVSRAYYAAYHSCKGWAYGLTVQGSNIGPVGGMHQEFVNRLRNPDRSAGGAAIAKSKLLGALLDVSRKHRVDGDYSLTADGFDMALAKTMLELSNRISAKASTFP